MELKGKRLSWLIPSSSPPVLSRLLEVQHAVLLQPAIISSIMALPDVQAMTDQPNLELIIPTPISPLTLYDHFYSFFSLLHQSQELEEI